MKCSKFVNAILYNIFKAGIILFNELHENFIHMIAISCSYAIVMCENR